MRIDQKTFFTALAFLAVVLKGKDANMRGAVNQVRQLSSLIEAFCAETIA